MPKPSGTPRKIQTRILIISDTHGVPPRSEVTPAKDHRPDQVEDDLSDNFSSDDSEEIDINRFPLSYREPLPRADVLLHCGDLTIASRLEEYQRTIEALRAAPAPLKIVIPGNHDMALDPEFCRVHYPALTEVGKRARELFREAQVDGVHLFEEGNFKFRLSNGASLKVFATAWTPEYGVWGFMYKRRSHRFHMDPDIDIAMSHGPPQGILDLTVSGDKAGCETLIEDVGKAKPKIHCFGHIHEGWGAFLGRWKPSDAQSVEPAAVLDEKESRLIIDLKGMKPPKDGESTQAAQNQKKKLEDVSKQKGYHVDLTRGPHQVTKGEHTMFINAAIMAVNYRPIQHPWIVDIDLDEWSTTEDGDQGM